MRLIQVKNDARYWRRSAVLARADPEYARDGDRFLRIAIGYRAGKIEQNSVRIDSGLNGWLDRGTESNFDPRSAGVRRHRDILHSGSSAWSLRGGARHEEHPDREMFSKGHYFFATLASTPLEPRAAAYTFHSAHAWPNRGPRRPRTFYPPPCPSRWHW